MNLDKLIENWDKSLILWDKSLVLWQKSLDVPEIDPPDPQPTSKFLDWSWKDKGIGSIWRSGNNTGCTSQVIGDKFVLNVTNGFNNNGARVFLTNEVGQWYPFPKELVGKTIRVSYPMNFTKSFTLNNGAGLFMTCPLEIKSTNPDGGADIQINVETKADGKLHFWLSLDGKMYKNDNMPAIEFGKEFVISYDILIADKGHVKLNYGGQSIEGDGRTFNEEKQGCGFAPFTLYTNAVANAEVAFGNPTIEVI